MERYESTSDGTVRPEYGTLPQAARRFGIGIKRIRKHAALGDFPIYKVGQTWPRVKFSDIEHWIQSTVIPPDEIASHLAYDTKK